MRESLECSSSQLARPTYQQPFPLSPLFFFFFFFLAPTTTTAESSGGWMHCGCNCCCRLLTFCWPVKSSQSVSINSQKENRKKQLFRWGSSRVCVGLVERRDGCADLLLRRSSLPSLGFHPGYSIRDCCYITKREREGGEYISIKDSSLSFSPLFWIFNQFSLLV